MSWRYPAQTPRSLASSVRGGWCETEGRTRRATRAATPRPLLPAVSRAFMTGLLVASVLLGICRVWHLRGCQGGQIRRSHTPGVTRSASVDLAELTRPVTSGNKQHTYKHIKSDSMYS